jgi:hypothetical protein
MSDKETAITELNTPESMQNARAYAGLFGEIPSSFTTVLRTLLVEHEKNGGSLSAGGRFAAGRLLRSNSIASPLYFASKIYRPEIFAGPGVFNSNRFMDVYSPFDLAVLIGTIYLYRRAKSVAEADEWAYIIADLQERVDISYQVGQAIPKIGGTIAVLCTAFPTIALATFQRHDKKGFKEYRRHLKSKGRAFDTIFEMRQWECTSVQIAAVFLQILGFGIEFSGNFSRGLLSVPPLQNKLDSTAYRFPLCSLWVDALLKSGAVPDMVHRGDFYPQKDALTTLLERVQRIRDGANRHPWLKATKDELTPDSAPELFQKPKTSAAAAPEPQAELPDNGDDLAEVETILEE